MTGGGKQAVPGISTVHKLLAKDWLNHSIYVHFLFSCADSSTIRAGQHVPDLLPAIDVL